MLKHISKIIAVFAIALVLAPSLALAHGGDNGRRGNGNDNRDRWNWSTNEFGVHILGEDNRKNDDNRNDKRDDKSWNKPGRDNKEFFANLFYSGEVTATSSTGFTIQTKNNESLNVNTQSAKIIRIPRTEINLSEVEVGDTVHVTGTKVNGTVTASVVYDMSQNLKPAIAKGTVTAVSDTSITVETQDNKTVTVNTDGDTQVIDQSGEVAITSDIEVGDDLKTFGLWDAAVHVFNAIKIKLF